MKICNNKGMRRVNMKSLRLKAALALTMSAAMVSGCGGKAQTSTPSASTKPVAESKTADTSEDKFKGETLSILVSTNWMDNRYDETISRFEETYGVTVDLQTIPAEQYGDILQSKLTSGTATDIFWIQSNPFAIESVIVDPESYCIDFTGAAWENVIPEARRASCKLGDTLYGMQLWHNSPEYVMVYNKTLFTELGITETPGTYEELLQAAEKIAAKDIVPWRIPGADGWQHQLAFFQIGGLYEQKQPGLYEALNTNKATFADNKEMLEVLAQFKELSDKKYFGEDWIGTDSTNMVNDFADRKIAMAMANSSFVKQIQDETATTDEFGLFLIPLGDNDTFPTSPAGPTMFGYKETKNEELVRTFFDFVSQTQSLQEILDNSPAYTNIHVNDDAVVQHWLPEEAVFMENIPESKMLTAVLQNGTKYTNDYWMDFGADMIAYCLGAIEANDVLKNMDANRAEAAALQQDPNWK